MDEELSFQTMQFEFRLPDGTLKTVGFIGEAICDRQTWKQIEENGTTFADLLSGNRDCIKLFEPIRIEELVADNPKFNNLVDIIREEAQRHHDELTSDE